MIKKNKVQYGKTDLLPKKIDPKDETIRISIIMEGDLLDAIKARALELGRPYQTLMKEILRQNLHKELPGEIQFDVMLQKINEINSKLDQVKETEDLILAKQA